MRGIQAATLQEIKEIRKGILLAKHNHNVESFKRKHENDPYEFINGWLEVQEQLEKIIIGGDRLSDLTKRACKRTMDNLKAD